MKFFVDSANLAEIEAALRRGFVSGVTTNPSLLAKEPKGNFNAHIKKIIALLKRYRDGAHLSVEVFSRDPKEILRQANAFRKDFNYGALSVKVHIGWNELETIRLLAEAGVSVNCTACMSVHQALIGAHAGARYVSLFWGRIRDGGTQPEFAAERNALLRKKTLDTRDFDPGEVVRETRALIEKAGLPAEIIAGSIRSVLDIRDAGLAGAHIVTVPPKFFPQMATHFKTDEVVTQFMTDFNAWYK